MRQKQWEIKLIRGDIRMVCGIACTVYSTWSGCKNYSWESVFLKNKLYVGDKLRGFDGICYITMALLCEGIKWK